MEQALISFKNTFCRRCKETFFQSAKKRFFKVQEEIIVHATHQRALHNHFYTAIKWPANETFNYILCVFVCKFEGFWGDQR